ncbi:protein Mpv17-like [Dorcoceras hygrometricum]|uniref:Protein Mpv17-like n=1 Tax=Dorcoceras hygrometricum TaxID=472368 RepID=A0A2Z6ZZX1_9LAMI|nr:protein Mpv17-like [Dorcoceras hygrometricum]
MVCLVKLSGQIGYRKQLWEVWEFCGVAIRFEVSDLVARDFVCGNYSSELRILELEDERVTPVYLISLLGSVSHYERSGYRKFIKSKLRRKLESARTIETNKEQQGSELMNHLLQWV